MRAELFASMKLADWPAADRSAWLAAQDGGPFVFSGGGASSWRPGSIKTVELAYGRWLFWLARHGEFDHALAPTLRATTARVRAYHADLVAARYAEHTVGGRLKHLGDALRVMDPDNDSYFINRGARLLISRASRATPIAGRMRPSKEIAALGRKLMQQARAVSPPTWREAKLFRDGLLIAFWAARPLRISNIAGLTLGANISKAGAEWRFAFAAREMKAKREFAASWPAALTGDLEDYLAVYRPLLAKRAPGGASTRSLWLSSRGSEFKLDSVAGVISERTKAEFGRSIHPHLIRHIIATEIAENRPTNVSDIAAVLHHSGMATSYKYYNKAGPFRAAQAYDKLLLAKRKEVTPRRPPKA